MQAANATYATDHNGRFVPLDERDENGVMLGDWTQNTEFMALITGDESLLTKYPDKFNGRLPHQFLDPAVVRTKARLWDVIFASYGYNQIVPGLPPGQIGGPRGFRMNQITNPARSVAFVTGTDHYFKYSGRLLWESNPVEGKSKDGKLAFRHGGKAIVTYYDGSTSMVGPAEIRSFDSKGGANHPFWKADY
jgi:prepilin-type processing-associated H-X9-DG protein